MPVRPALALHSGIGDVGDVEMVDAASAADHERTASESERTKTMENPQNTPSEQDMRLTNDNPSIDRVADDMDAGAGLPPAERMGGTPMDTARVRPEPLVDEEESDVLIETPVDASGMPLEGGMRSAGGAESVDIENTYEAPEDLGGPSSTPSQTGVVGSGQDSLDESETGLEGESTPSSTGVVGAGETTDGGTLPAPER